MSWQLKLYSTVSNNFHAINELPNYILKVIEHDVHDPE